MEENIKEFTPITSQEALDAVLKDRLNRQNDKHSKELEAVKAQYADYDALKEEKSGYETKLNELSAQLTEANDKVTGYDEKIASLSAQVKAYETLSLKERFIREYDLAADAIDFLNGDDEETIRAAAEKLQKLAPKQKVAPMATPNGTETDGVMAAFKALNPNIKF